MILLRLISWPYFRKHVLRSLLTTAGIVLGVAVFVGMHTANQSVLFAFSRTVDRIAGKTEIQVTAGETGFDEAVLEKVQAASTVRVAVPVIESVVDPNLPGEGNMLVLGVDMTGDRSLRDYDLESGDEAVIDDPLVFLAQPDSLIVTKAFAEKNHFDVGSRLPLKTAEGDRQFVIRGIMKSSGLTSAFGGNLAIMDIYAAQKMFGRGRKFDRIDLAVVPGRSIAQAEEELRALLGPGFQVDPPSGRGQQFEQMLAAYSIMVSVSSVFALFIGMFIIYNSFAIAVTERRSEIGILRALGATRGQIRRLFLGESAITGLVGSLAGLGFGVLIARGIAASIGTLINDVYGVAQHADEVAASPQLLGWALVIGVATSIVAALIPARNAAKVDPVHALQKGKYQVLTAGESRLRALLAALLAGVSVACLALTESRPAFYFGYFLVLRGRAAPQPVAVARARQTDAAGAEMAAACRRSTRRGQPHSGAPADVFECRRVDALDGRRRRIRRDGGRQLRLDHRLDGHGAESGPLRAAVPERRRANDSVSANDGAGDCGAARRGTGADGARCAHHLPRHADHGRGRRGREHRPDGTPGARLGRRGRDVPADRAGARLDGVGQPGPASASDASAKSSRFRRQTA